MSENRVILPKATSPDRPPKSTGDQNDNERDEVDDDAEQEEASSDDDGIDNSEAEDVDKKDPIAAESEEDDEDEDYNEDGENDEEDDEDGDDEEAEEAGEGQVFKTSEKRENEWITHHKRTTNSHWWRDTAAKHFQRRYIAEKELEIITQRHWRSLAQLKGISHETARRDLGISFESRSKSLKTTVTQSGAKADFGMMMFHHLSKPPESRWSTRIQLPDARQRTPLGIKALSVYLRTDHYEHLLNPSLIKEAEAETSRRPEVATGTQQYGNVIASQWGSITRSLPRPLSTYLPASLVRADNIYSEAAMYSSFPYLIEAISENRDHWVCPYPVGPSEPLRRTLPGGSGASRRGGSSNRPQFQQTSQDFADQETGEARQRYAQSHYGANPQSSSGHSEYYSARKYS